MEEIYKIRRPKDFGGVVGQKAAVDTLTRLLGDDSLPHTILFSGPSGVGKTTLARILARKLGCSKQDFVEMNGSANRGIDDIRKIQQHMYLAPMHGTCRVWCIDEAHALTKDAQNALLKSLEDTPVHVYFFLCTTDAHKLLATIKTRCTEFTLKAIKDEVLEKLVKGTAADEGMEVSDMVLSEIVRCADNSARKALVLLNAIKGLTDEDEQMKAVDAGDYKALGYQIAQALFAPNGTDWPTMAKLLGAVEEDPEGIRYMVLAWATKIMLGNGKQTARAFDVIEEFKKNFYDSKKAGLVSACYYLLVASKRK